jgi:uncharacterized membrane protein YccC
LSLDEHAAAKFSILMSRILASVLTRRRAELRHGLRIAAAGMASFALAQALGLPQGYWAVFTAVLVVQGSVGGSWKAAVDRLLGTLLGAVYGAVIATVVPHENVLMLGTALAISLTPLALLAAVYPAYRVAPITAVILLLGSTSVAEGPFLAAVLRTGEVTLGAFVGMAVSLFLLPARAHALMGNAANRVLQRLADLFAALLNGLTAPLDGNNILAKNDAVRAAQAALEIIADEAARERRNYLAEDADPEPVARTLRRVRHDLVLIGRVAAEPLPEDIRNHLQPCLAELSAAGEGFLRAVGLAFAERKPPAHLDAFEAALARVLGEIEAVKGNGRLVALDFAFEQLQRNLRDLTRRAQEFARSPALIPQAES